MKKRRKPAKKKKNSRFMIYLIIGVMLFSAFFLTTQVQQAPEDEEFDINLDFEEYSVIRVGNKTVLAVVSAMTSDIIIIPQSVGRLLPENLEAVLDAELDGVESIKGEFSDAYMLFKFTVSNFTQAEPEIERLVRSELRSHTTHRGYTAQVGKDDVYLIGSPKLALGDYVGVILLQKIVDNVLTEYVALENRKLPVGPDLPATVLEANGIRVFASFDKHMMLEHINESIDLTNLTVVQPTLYSSDLKNETLEKLEIAGVNITVEADMLTLSSDDIETLKKTLESEGVNYSVLNGSITFLLLGDLAEAETVLAEYGILDLTARWEAVVATPTEFVLNDRIVRIGDKMASFLFLNASVGDNITVNIKTVQFGEQVFSIGAEQI